MTKIGRSQLRFEDDCFLRGQGQYTDDIKQSDDATLVFVRSPHAAAQIVKVHLDRAKTIEGAIAIFGWEEMHANKAGSFKPRAQFPGPDNGAMRIPPFTPLADGYVRYCGEPVLGIIATDKLEDEWGKDPSKVVLDEVIGVWIAMMFVPFSFFNVLLAFGLFRYFDIAKPLGIRKLEALNGGLGVMADDMLAGIYSNITLQIILALLAKFYFNG